MRNVHIRIGMAWREASCACVYTSSINETVIAVCPIKMCRPFFATSGGFIVARQILNIELFGHVYG